MSLLLEVGAGELVKVADLDVADDVLRENVCLNWLCPKTPRPSLLRIGS
jgi:hypothetical protein